MLLLIDVSLISQMFSTYDDSSIDISHRNQNWSIESEIAQKQ